MNYDIVNDSFGFKITFYVSGIDLADFITTEAQTAIIITDTVNEPVTLIGGFKILLDSFNTPTGGVEWLVPKTATVGNNTPLQYEGTFNCQLEFIDVTRANISTATKRVRTKIFNINNKHTLGE